MTTCPTCSRPVVDQAQDCPACGAVLMSGSSMLAPSFGVQVGQEMGHYTILSRIGAGGMGEVFLARDNKLERRVALKLLPSQFTQDAERVRRFMQEARAVSALNHPHIITVYEIGEAAAGRFIVMELVKGRTLGALDKPCPPDLLVSLGSQIAKALTATHSAGITHRDIKPDNIMLREDGYVKVLDFGLARLMPAAASDTEAATLAFKTMPGALLGTLAYMSPEQVNGGQATPASDIFALGVVFYEMATGEHPFKAETLVGMLHSIGTQRPQPPARLKPETPVALDALILRMLEKEAANRPTAREVDLALQAIERHAESSAQSTRLPLDASPQESRLKPELKTPSIAVLPFVNISNDTDNEYFCDGLAEELIGALSKIGALRVAARTSAFSFKGKEADIREIGRKLNVGAVLEGSVRKAGYRLRITAQLINVADGYHLWSERYDRELQDIFDIQDEITLSIVEALKVKLLGAEKAAVTKRYTDNTEAYQLYLKGRYQYGKYTEEGFRKSIEYFEQAIKKESDYAPAFAALTMSYVGLWYYGFAAPDQTVPKAQSEAARALAIGQSLAETHYALAVLKFYYEWDWRGAEREFKQALALNPNYAEAHEQYAVFLAVMGRSEAALAEATRALELAPLSLQTNLNVGWAYWFAGRADLLFEQGRKLIELEPSFFGGHWLLGAKLWLEGSYEQALPEFEAAVALDGGPSPLGFLGSLYGIMGKREQAQQALEELQAPGAQRDGRRLYIALVYAGLGELDRAFDLLEQAYQQREGVLVCLKYIGLFIPGLSVDPRFDDLLRRIGLPQ